MKKTEILRRLPWLGCVCMLFITACSAFPAEKVTETTTTFEDGTEYSVIVNYQHEDTPVTLRSSDYATIAHLLTISWQEDSNLPHPGRINICLQKSYWIIVNNEVTSDLCKRTVVGSDPVACNYTKRNFRVRNGYDAPYNVIVIANESGYSDCYTAVWTAVHELTHSLVECKRNQWLLDNGGRAHNNSLLWARFTPSIREDDLSLGARVVTQAMHTIYNDSCGFPTE